MNQSKQQLADFRTSAVSNNPGAVQDAMRNAGAECDDLFAGDAGSGIGGKEERGDRGEYRRQFQLAAVLRVSGRDRLLVGNLATQAFAS